MYRPAWDVYSLGVTLWEIVMDSSSPPENQTPGFEASGNEPEASKIAVIARKCFKEDPAARPSAESIFMELGGLSSCGCSAI